MARALVLAAFAVLTAAGAALPAGTVPANPAALEAAARLSALLVVGFEGTQGFGNAELERLLCQTHVGGIVLFARNVTSPEQVRRLAHEARDITQACTGRPLLVAVDAEGGRVMRLGPAAGHEATLSHQELGERDDLALTEAEAGRIARMLREAGIGWNLAPVVDVGLNPANPVIVRHGRAFGTTAAQVTAHARAWIRGMRTEGILTTLKHFPGHGSSHADSHVGFVDVTATANRDVELAPYRALIAEGLADSVMTAHVVNRTLDPRHPATLSRATLDLLRRDLGFDGPVVSDDLRMAAIDRHYGLARAAVLALRAGVDLLLIAEDRLPDGRSATEVVLAALRRALASGTLPAERVAAASRRAGALRARLTDLPR